MKRTWRSYIPPPTAILLRCATICVLLLAAAPVTAAPRLPALFTDHMVLQRDRPVPVWGWADAGEEIAVTFHGTTRTTQAGADGRWHVELPAAAAGGPFTLTVTGKTTVRVRDVLVGEVWVASGQSNMAFALASASRADAGSASHPQIRLFTVPRTASLEPAADVAASWVACTPGSAGEFSAVAYYFGRLLHRETGVPVGLIHTSWPGSTAEEWTPLPALQAHPDLRPIFDDWQRRAANWVGSADRPWRFDVRIESIELVSSDGSRQMSLMTPGPGVPGGPWRFSWASAPRVSFEWQAGLDAKPSARVYGELRAGDSARLTIPLAGDGSAADLSKYDVIRLRVSGRGVFQVRTLQPSLTDADDYTSETYTATPEPRDITVPLDSLKQAGWGRPVAFSKGAIGAVVVDLQMGKEGARPPAGLYNAMIAPLMPFGIRGAIWYQGESNTGRATQYRTLLPALIESWRKGWQAGDFPFLIVQLANFLSRSPQPQESNWAALREAQAMALRVPHTGLAVAIDVGEADDVHPTKKRPVGERLARWALGTVYDRPGVYSGPLFQSMQVEDSTIRLRFQHAGSGLATTDHRPPRGFAIAGPDHKFVWAQARIEGETVVVWHPEIPRPVAVRYAWADNPDCNLANREGLPAGPFRTDD